MKMRPIKWKYSSKDYDTTQTGKPRSSRAGTLGKIFIFFTLSPGLSPPHLTLVSKGPDPRSMLAPTSFIFSGTIGSNNTHAIRRASRHWYNTAPNSSAFNSSFAIRKGAVSLMNWSTLVTRLIAALVAFGSSRASILSHGICCSLRCERWPIESLPSNPFSC